MIFYDSICIVKYITYINPAGVASVKTDINTLNFCKLLIYMGILGDACINRPTLHLASKLI